MKTNVNSKKCRQAGSMINTIIYIMVMILVSVGALTIIAYMPSIRDGHAIDELTVLTSQMQRAAGVAEAGDLASFAGFVTQGYIDPKSYSDGEGENYYGKNITAVVAAATGVTTMTYITNEDEQCNFLKNEIKVQNRRLSADPSCAGATLTLKLVPGL